MTESGFFTLTIQYINVKTSDKAEYVHKLCRSRASIHAENSIGFQVSVGVLIIEAYVRDGITKNGIEV